MSQKEKRSLEDIEKFATLALANERLKELARISYGTQAAHDLAVMEGFSEEEATSCSYLVKLRNTYPDRFIELAGKFEIVKEGKRTFGELRIRAKIAIEDRTLKLIAQEATSPTDAFERVRRAGASDGAQKSCRNLALIKKYYPDKFADILSAATIKNESSTGVSLSPTQKQTTLNLRVWSLLARFKNLSPSEKLKIIESCSTDFDPFSLTKEQWQALELLAACLKECDNGILPNWNSEDIFRDWDGDVPWGLRRFLYQKNKAKFVLSGPCEFQKIGWGYFTRTRCIADGIHRNLKDLPLETINALSRCSIPIKKLRNAALKPIKRALKENEILLVEGLKKARDAIVLIEGWSKWHWANGEMEKIVPDGPANLYTIRANGYLSISCGRFDESPQKCEIGVMALGKQGFLQVIISGVRFGTIPIKSVTIIAPPAVIESIVTTTDLNLYMARISS